MSGKKKKAEISTPKRTGGRPQTAPPRLLLPERFLKGPWLALWAGLLLAAFAVQAITAMAQKSCTTDEHTHLPAGYSYLVKGDFRLNPEHPPLIKMIAALPLIFQHVNGNFDSDGWRYGEGLQYGWELLYKKNDADTILFQGRLMMVIMSLCLGLLIFFWARKLSSAAFFPARPAPQGDGGGSQEAINKRQAKPGNGAGLFALFLFAFSPNMLAHGQLTNTDVGVSLFMLLSLFCFDRAARKLTPASALLAGFTLGLALLAKFSGVLMLPVLAAAGLVRVLDGRPLELRLGRVRVFNGRLRKLAAVAALLCVMLSIAYAVIWAGYAFRYEAITEPGGRFSNMFYEGEKAFPPDALSRFAREHRLLPEAFLVGFHNMRTHMNRMAYLDGKKAEIEFTQLLDEHGNPRRKKDGSLWEVPVIRGWRHYFIMTFLYKTPVPTMIFLLVSVAGAFWLSRRTWSFEAPLISLFVIYYAVAILSSMNIGHRHILPVLPPLFIFVGKMPGFIARRKRSVATVLSVIFAALLGWYAFGTIRIWPHHLAYFNEPSGGPERGFEHLSDSNIDWGQDLKPLKRYMDEHDIKKIYLSYFGNADPLYYGIDFVNVYSHFIPDRFDSVLLNRPVVDSNGRMKVMVFRKGDRVAISGSLLIDTFPIFHPYRQVENAMPVVTRYLRERAELETKIGYSIYVYRIPADFALPVVNVTPTS